ncbi:hypothetical protein Cantr_02914 [Candida viswanathii]|uniref:Uncharacterized protein n=1 Tax=Candida viswanathii TaxID=5486 RepID=A0A367YNX9_9ASCO|nr:hypothetical protein Cantr_02914 [Candida viswanathii]
MVASINRYEAMGYPMLSCTGVSPDRCNGRPLITLSHVFFWSNQDRITAVPGCKDTVKRAVDGSFRSV